MTSRGPTLSSTHRMRLTTISPRAGITPSWRKSGSQQREQKSKHNTILFYISSLSTAITLVFHLGSLLTSFELFLKKDEKKCYHWFFVFLFRQLSLFSLGWFTADYFICNFLFQSVSVITFDLPGIAISSSSHSDGKVEITSPSKISHGFIYQMLEFSYERLSDNLSFFCVMWGKLWRQFEQISDLRALVYISKILFIANTKNYLEMGSHS